MRFVLFGCIWDHFVALTKLDAKQAEQVQKFVPRSCVGIFRNECTRSTPLDPKLSFCCVSYYLVAFGTVGPNLCKSSCHEVASEFFATNTPDTPHWTLKLRFGAFHNIWVHLGPFGCLTKLGAKRAELVEKFVHEVALEFFATNAPDPPHWTLNLCFLRFVQFGCISDRLVA